MRLLFELIYHYLQGQKQAGFWDLDIIKSNWAKQL